MANPNIVAHWPTDPFKDRLIAPEILNQALEGTPKHTNADGSELEARTPLAVFTRGRASTFNIEFPNYLDSCQSVFRPLLLALVVGDLVYSKILKCRSTTLFH